MFIVLTTGGNDMLDSFLGKAHALPLIYFTIKFVIGAPRTLIVEGKRNQSQGLEATLERVLQSCLISRY